MRLTNLLRSVRQLLVSGRSPTPEQLAFRETLTEVLVRISKVSPATCAELPVESRVGALVGTIFVQALNERGQLHEKLSEEDLNTLTIRLAYACFAVSKRAGLPLNAAVIANALCVIDFRFVETQVAAEIVPAYIDQVIKRRSGPRAHAPTAEEMMTMRYIDRGELLTLQGLGKQLEGQIFEGRAEVSASLREVFESRSPPT